MVEGKPNWTLVAHAGTVAHSHLMLSMVQAHYTNKGIRENKVLSVNVVDESWLKEVDRMGTISGNKEDKSQAFSYTVGENGAPLIDDAKLSIECEADGNYELEGFDNFICKILATHAEESILNEAGKINYHVFKPVLFEFPTYEYFVTGDKAGDCAKMNKYLIEISFRISSFDQFDKVSDAPAAVGGMGIESAGDRFLTVKRNPGEFTRVIVQKTRREHNRSSRGEVGQRSVVIVAVKVVAVHLVHNALLD
ncbi:MAG: flavin reductase family protein, partial [Eubacterium sp.]